MSNYTKIDESRENCIVYKKGNMWHRLDGPAVITKPGHTSITEDLQYWINDRSINTKEEYYNHPEVIKYANEMKLRKLLNGT